MEAVTIRRRLPSKRYRLRAVYDGDDEVYLLGGYAGAGRLDEVVQLSLSTEEILINGRFPDGIAIGTAEFAFGKAYYFGGYTSNASCSSDIWAKSQTSLNPYPNEKDVQRDCNQLFSF